MTLCKTKKPPVLAFERWLGRASIRSSNKDPLIPSDGVLDHGLVKDLTRALGPSEGQVVAEAMAAEGHKASEKILSFQKDSSGTNGASLDLTDYSKALKKASSLVKDSAKMARTSLEDDQQKNLEESLAALRTATRELDACAAQAQRTAGFDSKVHIDGSRRFGIYDVSLLNEEGVPKKPYLTISSPHLHKLFGLWKAREKADNASKPVKDVVAAIQALPDRVLFLNSLYCCLARYEGLKGAGYQCAVPGIAFDAAEKCGLGNTIECFASPLNCRFKQYCSAFPDVEGLFGSLGSFFEFSPTEGSFEANPPFVPEIMTAMGERIEKLLGNQYASALSFLVVVPAWGAGMQFVEHLEASEHVRAQAHIPAADHVFCDGAQHNRVPRHGSVELRPSSWDTAVVLLQNEAGAAKWPVDTQALEDSFCAALRQAAESVPKHSSSLQGWEKRGVARGGRGPPKRPRTQY